MNRKRPPIWPLIALLAYVAAVHAVDTMATLGFREPIAWRMFHWTAWPGSAFLAATNGGRVYMQPPPVDLFKFAAWFILPFCFCLPCMDWGALGVTRWRRMDWGLLAGLAALGALAVLVILAVPGLRGFYPSLEGAAAGDKASYALHTTAYTLSWLMGWEFIHRYALLRVLDARWPRYGWLLIPVYEGAYHLVKHPLEMAAMVAFSLLLTYWAKRRRNVLLPFLAHLAVELELLAFMVLV